MPQLFSKQDFLNTKWFIAEKLTSLLVAIIIIPKIFNSLGVLNIGKLKFAETFVNFFTPIIFLGLSAICIRELIFYPKRTKFILATALYLRTASWLLSLIVIFTYTYFFIDNNLLILYLLICFSYLVRVFDVFEYYFHAIKQTKYVFISKSISLLIVVLLQYYGVKNQIGIEYFASLIILDFLIQSIIYYSIIKTKNIFSFKDLVFSKVLAKYLLKNSFPLILSNFLILIYIVTDDFILKYYHGDESYGLYSTIYYLIITLTWSIGFSIINALFPSLAESYTTNLRVYYQKISSIIIYMLALGVLIIICYNLFSYHILNNFFDKSFLKINNMLKLFSWAPLFIFIGMIFEKHLIITNHIEKNVYRFILGCISNLILSMILIPKYEITGAIIAVLFSHFITNIGFLFLDTKSRKQLNFLFLK
ncbi:oligosaccharide flippase family protein [Lutibacter flavus]|uniref:Membrane protein involved in the export of O-antigen and teichoic acid n=1 Tax=Lutibacter flavus TaxID=691689 RepID=A0A238XIP9_9FLAO|nr:oligosaccharide flippase family protein [Lutibacter flavus]SNR58458.1 Membrane protein involved in the export of O-antigen and teichoic acid [Lutibacter flavus]